MYRELLGKLGLLRTPLGPTEGAPLVLVDVGCRWGFAERFLEETDDIHLYGFDPDVEECERLSAIYPQKNVHIVPKGLAEKPGKYCLYRTKEPACSSMYKPLTTLTESYPSLDCATLMDEVSFEATTLDHWSKENDISYIDYIKLDTQGSELNILRGGKKILSTTRIIELEVEFNPIYENQPLFNDIDRFLRAEGFVLWGFLNLIHYSKRNNDDIELTDFMIAHDSQSVNIRSKGGQLFWADACYVKKEMLAVGDCSVPPERVSRDVRLAAALNATDIEVELESNR